MYSVMTHEPLSNAVTVSLSPGHTSVLSSWEDEKIFQHPLDGFLPQ